MIARVLSIAGPLSVYISLGVLIYGLWKERRKFDWVAVVPALAGLAASVALLPPVHRLFFDEDIYINIAGNLAQAPVNQVTVLGGPDEVQVSSYYKEPPGWPVLLSLVFIAAGRSEGVAFWVARLLFAIAIVAVFHLAKEMLKTRSQGLIAAILFGATPVCFWFSVSAGTDIPAALLAAIGMWGALAGNGALAAGGIALAAQTRMELLILTPLIFASSKIPLAWKIRTALLTGIEVVHVAWVMSVAPMLAEAERVEAVFSPGYAGMNLRRNIAYLLDPYMFFGVAMVVALAVALYQARRTGRAGVNAADGGLLAIWALALFCVYLSFYAGRFDLNPRYSIQILTPLAVLAAALMKGRRAILLLSIILPYTRAYEFPAYVQALAADHRISAEFASQIHPDDLVVSAQAEMFINHDRRAMNAVFASQNKEALEEQIGRRKVWYHSGVRANALDTVEGQADRWVKSNFELHLIQSQSLTGMRIAFYELLLQRVDREARLRRSFEGKSNGGPGG